MKTEKELLNQLETRKKILVEQLKKLNNQIFPAEMSTKDLDEKKRKVERELVEIMDRLTQLNYLLKK